MLCSRNVIYAVHNGETKQSDQLLAVGCCGKPITTNMALTSACRTEEKRCAEFRSENGKQIVKQKERTYRYCLHSFIFNNIF